MSSNPIPTLNGGSNYTTFQYGIPCLLWVIIDGIAERQFIQYELLSQTPVNRILASGVIATQVILGGSWVISLVTPIPYTVGYACLGVIMAIFCKAYVLYRIAQPFSPQQTQDYLKMWPETSTHLNLQKCIVTDEIWNHIADKYNSLTSLTLNGNNFKGLFSDLRPMTSLEKLTLSNYSDVILKIIKQTPNLNELIIKDSKDLDPKPLVQAVKNIGKFVSLKINSIDILLKDAI